MGELLGAGKRLLTGESLFMTMFTNTGGASAHVAFAAPYPGSILPMDLKTLGGELICQKDSFLCAAKGIPIGIAFQQKIGAGLFGGEGFIMQRLQGDGIAFVHAGGMLHELQLEPGETLRVDTGCLVALQPIGQLRHPVRRRLQERALRRRRPVLRHAHRPRPRLAAVAAVQPPGRPHRQGHPRRQRRRSARRRLRARRPRQPVGRRLMPQFIYVMKGLGKVHQPDHVVLKDIWLSFLPGAKIGVLGLNGAGKCSLLKIMAGQDTEFIGEAFLAQGSTVGYLPQEPTLDPIEDGPRDRRGGRRRDARAPRPLRRDQREVRRGPVARGDGQGPRGAGQGPGRIDALNAWDLDSQLEIAMDALRCPPPDTPVTQLSGGERRRVALCRLLLQQPDMLLLDEPTNHLDAESVAWLEQHLQEYPGTVIAVTHDRYFLDNVAGWILELDRGGGIPWEGNYSSWLEQKQQRLALEEKSESRRQSTLERELEWIRMSPRARQAKGKARLTAYEKLLNEDAQQKIDKVEIYIPPGPRLGDVVVEAKDLRKGYGDTLLIDGLNFHLPPGGIVGVIGPNGAGKTTLFRMIIGKEKPDSGTLRIGETVKLGYVDQARELDRTKRSSRRSPAAATRSSWARRRWRRAPMSRGSTSRGATSRRRSASSRAASATASTWPSSSPGANVLLLDEPTNDLDVDTLRALEEALLEFAGCAVVISHDRWFLDRIATHILAFEGDPRWSGSRATTRPTRRTAGGAWAPRPTSRTASSTAS